MKTIRTISLAAIVLAVVSVHAQIAPYGISNNDGAHDQSVQSDPSDSMVQLTADAQGLQPVSPDQIPVYGTYWTIMPGSGSGALPFPCMPPGDNLPMYVIADTIYLVDDTATTNSVSEAELEAQATEVVNLISLVQAAASQQAQAMARPIMGGSRFSVGGATPDGGPGFPGGGTNDGGSYDLTNLPPIVFGTNLWLEITNISGVTVNLMVSNTVADVQYEIDGTTNLAPSSWIFEGFFLGSELTNWTPTSIQAFSRTNNLFLRVKSWQSSDGSGLPDWWELQYFGYLGVDPYGDPAGDGYNNLWKFLHGMNPNVFYTPPAPQNFATSYNLNTSTETVTWSPSPGPITSYTLTVDNEQTGQTTNITLSATNTSFSMYLAPEGPDFDVYPPGPQINVVYGLAANYGTNGSSPSASQYAEGDAAPSAELINGADGRLCYIFQGLPADLSAVRIYRQHSSVYRTDYPNVEPLYAEDDLIFNMTNFPLADGYFEMPVASITNNICELPDTQAPPFFAYSFWVQTVRSNGMNSAWTTSTAILSDEYNASKPFIDVRRQLKDNLIFLLRAATEDGPFAFSVNEGSETWYVPSEYTWPNNYAYADYYNNYGDSFTASEVRPLYDNYFYRNFLFDSGRLTSDEFLNTGISEATPVAITNYPTYYFDVTAFITATNPTVPSSQLTAALSEYILPGDASVESFSGGTIATGVQNCYGLPFVSEEIAWDTNGETVIGTFNPGSSFPNGVNGVEYYDMAEPGFHSAGYYFAKPGIDPMPEQSGFAPTGAQPLMIAGVGNSITIAGYNNLAVTNGHSGAYGYLGQYFQAAYQVNTSGVVTDSSAGTVSPYGVFAPTVPGPAALVTIPDIDPPYEQGTCLVYSVSLQLDANHDGSMDLSFDGADATSANKPMELWVNNDNDGTGIGNDIDITGQTNRADYTYGQIRSQRNLEDFFRLWICGLPTLPTSQGYAVTLSMTPSSGNPVINMYPAYDPAGSSSYLTDTNMAAEQLSTEYLMGVPEVSFGDKLCTVSNGQSYSFSLGTSGILAFTHFLFEGAGIGAGELTLTIAQSNNVIAQTSAYLDLHDIKDFYERMTITNSTSGASTNWHGAIQNEQYATTSALGDDTNMIVFIHGFNVPVWKWLNSSETTFKRLYWERFQGQFSTVKWPCQYSNPFLADLSEQGAYKASTGLKDYLDQLRTRVPGFRLNLLAHSQGAAIASEAISHGAPYDSYIMSQCAIPASTFDVNAPTDTSLLDAELTQPTPNLQPTGYCGIYTNVTGRIINYYNPVDWALETGTSLGIPTNWKENQLVKPDTGFGSDGTNVWDNSAGPNTPVTDPQVIRARVARSRSLAIGAQGLGTGETTQGVVTTTLNLNTTFGFTSVRPDHSAEWNWPIQSCWPYYDQLLESFLIPSTH